MKEYQNYHSRLLQISKSFDSPIEQLKGSYIEHKNIKWYWWLIKSPFRDMARIKEVNDGIKKFHETGIGLAIIPILSSVLSPTALILFDDLGEFTKMLVGFGAGYLFVLFFYFQKMLQFNSGHFHIGAYQIFRSQEYNLFKVAFLDIKGDFFFKGMYDYITASAQSKEEFERLYDRVDTRLDRYLSHDKHQLQTKVAVQRERLKRNDKEIKKIEEIHNEARKEYEFFINKLISERDELLNGISYIIELIKDINRVLFRIQNNVFSTKDLNLVSGFTIYEIRKNRLKKIEDVGTTGSTPQEISLEGELFKDWAVVKIAKEGIDTPLLNNPYQNHSVISFRMSLHNPKKILGI